MDIDSNRVRDTLTLLGSGFPGYHVRPEQQKITLSIVFILNVLITSPPLSPLCSPFNQCWSLAVGHSNSCRHHRPPSNSLPRNDVSWQGTSSPWSWACPKYPITAGFFLSYQESRKQSSLRRPSFTPPPSLLLRSPSSTVCFSSSFPRGNFRQPQLQYQQ